MDGTRPRNRRRRRWAVISIVPALLFGWYVWSLTHAGNPSATGTRTYDKHGVEFEYPASWDVREQIWPSGTIASTAAILGTHPWGLCLPLDINCHYEQRLDPGQISVDLVSGGFMFDFCEIGATGSDLEGRGPSDPPATRTLMRVDGRPTLQTDYVVNRIDYYHSDAWRSWTIAAPGTLVSVIGIDAKYQGPDVDTFRRQLDDLVASFRFTGPPAPGFSAPDDCAAPFPDSAP